MLSAAAKALMPALKHKAATGRRPQPENGDYEGEERESSEMYLCCPIHHHLGIKKGEVWVGSRTVREEEEEGQNGKISAPQKHQRHHVCTKPLMDMCE